MYHKICLARGTQLELPASGLDAPLKPLYSTARLRRVTVTHLAPDSTHQ